MQQDLVTEYKKVGAFDAKRKAWFEAVVSNEELQKKLNKLVDKLVRVKIEKDPELVINDSRSGDGSGSGSGKLSALIQTELVKRQVQRAKTTAKDDSPTEISLSEVETMTETELLDAINALVAQTAGVVQAEDPVDVVAVAQNQ